MRRTIVSLVAVGLVTSACTTSQPLTAAVDAGQLGQLQSIDELAATFNDDVGQPRLILLLSPT